MVKLTDLSSTVPCWIWNGYTAQWVYSVVDRETLIRQVLETIENADKQRLGGLASVEILEDGEFITVVVQESYEFYGCRKTTNIFTTRPGEITQDEDGFYCGAWNWIPKGVK